MEIETEPGVILGCRFYLHSVDSPNILYFHGNGERVCDYDEVGPHYNQAGINLLVTDYRGYGSSTGTPTVASMLSDAEVLFQECRNWLKFNGYKGAFFVMGRSLGSVAAIDLAVNHENDIKGLILESAIADTIPLLKTVGITGLQEEITEEDGFRNLEKIEKVTKPTFILHGARDELIPASDAEKLQSHCGARTKEFVVIPGASHNSMIATGGALYFQTIKKFIDKLTGASNWRRRRKKTNKFTGKLS
ncbi:MAG: alpha/beta hydrolase [Thermodesulfobacteriota bacterium]